MKGFGFVFLGIWILLFACLGVYGVVQAYLFDLRCGDYLKLAADASSVKMADDFLAKSIDYLNRTGKISGNSAIIFKKPKHDVGIWYRQILAAKSLTEQMVAKGDKATALENSNVLMKVRETLLDNGEHGQHLTLPVYISLVPNQLAYILLWWLLIPFGLLVWGMLWAVYTRSNR